MEQVVSSTSVGSGKVSVEEVPMPQLGKGMVLVENHYSIISAGTEGNNVKTNTKSLIQRAKESPTKIFQMVKRGGFLKTYNTVMKKLSGFAATGYSSAGVVIDVAEDVHEFKVGDKVACAGANYANHAEVVAVPVNLCVKLDKDADLSLACYNTLGAIALQGVRQCDVRLGETVGVIGLGLIGQIACMELQASGVKVVGIDVSPSSVSSSSHCTDLAIVRNQAGIEQRILDYTNGIGVDAVLITAGTASLDPINFAGVIAKKKGRVVVLGAVPTGFDRADYYAKELELRMSCSYGPGRYDLNYEEKGIDYPVGYVRWTEKRNMEAFQYLVHTGKIDVNRLTTHRFKLEDAPKAFDIIMNKTEPYLGMLLEYDTNKEHKRGAIVVNEQVKLAKVNVGFIGAGYYAHEQLLPNLPPEEEVGRICVMTNSGTSGKSVAHQYHFKECTSNVNDILENKDINTVFIATRHDTHARYILECIKAGKNVYTEKPLCLTIEEMEEIRKACEEMNKGVMIGFNRRFAPSVQAIKKVVGSGRMSMMYRVNAGYIPSSSWAQDMKVGGGRIIGEVCHFIDLMSYMCGSKPCKVVASALPDNENLNDTVNIIVDFENGSTGVIAYYANGSKQLSKEYFEVYSAGTTAVVNDFCKYEIYGKGKTEGGSNMQDKGQKEMMRQFFQSLKDGNLPIPLDEIFAVTTATFAILKSLQEDGAPVSF